MGGGGGTLRQNIAECVSGKVRDMGPFLAPSECREWSCF